jgi:hypothetical protein
MKITFYFLAIGFSLIFLVAATPTAYEIVPVNDGGAIRGKVTFSGEIPEPKKFLITKDTETCGTGEREVQEINVAPDGALKDVVVYLEGVQSGKDWTHPEKGYILDQKGCRFISHLTVIPKGEKLVILNSDPFLHNIHTYEIIGRARLSMFNNASQKNSRFAKLVKPRRENVIKVECDVHEFMHGWMFAVENPYYAQTKADGKFALTEIPPGTYQLKAWHPTLGVKAREVKVEPNGKLELSFEFNTTEGGEK